MKGLVIRWMIAGVFALALLVGLALALRWSVLLVAPARDDSVYAVATTASVGTTPVVKELLLNAPHGLLGERPNDSHAAITVIISRGITGEISVVNAWSPVSDCAVTVSSDRLADCAGHAWTFAGDPLLSSDPPLQRFAVTNENGALIADLTHPVDAGR